MSDNELSRRGFLFRAAVLGAVALGSGTILARCKSDSGDGGVTCDTSGLTEQQRSMRGTLGYVDVSIVEGRNCANCQLYTPPPNAQTCGTCTLGMGQVADGGYCNSWAQRVTAEGTG